MSYLMAGKEEELERLQLQSKVWEPAGRRLLEEIGPGSGLTVLDVGCGALGWLRLLSEWVGASGRVFGTDNQASMLEAAGAFAAAEGLPNLRLELDDLFDSKLPAASFDAVHVRFELTPLGRFEDQMAAYRRLVKPGGLLIVEECDAASWRTNPQGPATGRLIELICDAFIAAGGDINAGRHLPRLLGPGARIRAELLALEPGHPYLRLPLQFAVSLEPRLLQLVDAAELQRLRAETEVELASEGLWGTTFTLIQAWTRL